MNQTHSAQTYSTQTRSTQARASRVDAEQSDSTTIQDVERVSPEGAPANPRVSPHGIVLRFAGVLLATVAASLLIGVFFGFPGALIAAISVIAAAAIYNPELWSVPSRMKDRERAARNASDPA